MKHEQIKLVLAESFAQLDASGIAPPIELTIRDYSFYPYRGFSEIQQAPDFARLKLGELKTLLAIAHDLNHMRKRELFEAFVNDDGVIAIEADQPHIEYSVDVGYNDAGTKADSVYPQITYPIDLPLERHRHSVLVGNDTVHESAHHMDSWIDIRSHATAPISLHSSSTLLQWCAKLDRLLHPGGVADLVIAVRQIQGYDPRLLLRDGYSKGEVVGMLRAEFFAIAAEYYYGSPQGISLASPLLEAYFQHIVTFDIEIQGWLLSIREMHMKRGILRRAIHAPLETLLGQHHSVFLQAFHKQHTEVLENALIEAMKELVERTRKLIEK